MKRSRTAAFGSASVKKQAKRMRFTRAPVRRKSRTKGINVRTGGLLGVEKKFKDYSYAQAIASPTDSTGGELDPTGSSVLCLNAVAQGDGPSERDGRSIRMISLQIQGTFSASQQINQSAMDPGTTFTLWVVHDRQTNGAQMNSEDCFTNPAASSLTAPMPFRNIEYNKRFRILARRTWHIPPMPGTYDGTNIEQAGDVIPFQFFVKLNKMPVNFKAGTTTGVVANIIDNSIHLIGFSTSNDLVVTVAYNARLRFVG